ncbi:hypothetical protein M8J76_002591 [Diaphorina citri]|nr:hypothetical protein M8J76_002591 [Diaphorina citri]
MEPNLPDISAGTEVTCGTTTIACEYENGVMMGADTRTTLGTYVCNREAEKLTKISDNIYCCRSGTAADTQAISDLVSYHIDLDVAYGYREMNEPPLVYRAANLFQKIFRSNEGSFKAAIIIAGWDTVKGGQVYALPASGVLTRQNCAVGGSGSSYILGYVDKEWRANMKKQECIDFIKMGLSLAMARDYASGGLINIGVLENGKPMEKLLDLILKDEAGGDLTTFITNGEWYLLGMPGKKNEVQYECCPETYVDITFTIQIRRRTLYYFFNLIVPCVLISSMALLGFTLPPDSGEKLTLGVTILLSLTVFLNLVAETLPQVLLSFCLTLYFCYGSPKYYRNPQRQCIKGTYFNCIMFMVASSVVLTVVVLNYHHRTADSHEMPDWIRFLFLQWIPWILCMQRPHKKITRKTIAMSNKMRELELKERTSKSLMANVLNIDDDFRHVTASSMSNSSNFIRSGISIEDPGSSSQCSVTQRELRLILKELQFITARMKKSDEEAETISDWKFAAMVVDRLCLIVFTLFTIIATITVLLSAPHIIVQ